MEFLKCTEDAPEMDIFTRKELGLNFGGNGKK